MSFDEFSKTSFKFLNELSENNTKTWFDENKQTYQDNLLKPIIAFIKDLSAQLQKVNLLSTHKTYLEPGDTLGI